MLQEPSRFRTRFFCLFSFERSLFSFFFGLYGKVTLCAEIGLIDLALSVYHISNSESLKLENFLPVTGWWQIELLEINRLG